MNWRHFPMMTAICWFSNILQRLTVSQIINQFGSFLLSDCRSARAGCTQSFLLNCSCHVDLKHILCALDFSCQEVVKASTLTQKDHEAGLALVLMTAHGEIWNRNRMIIAFFHDKARIQFHVENDVTFSSNWSRSTVENTSMNLKYFIQKVTIKHI